MAVLESARLRALLGCFVLAGWALPRTALAIPAFARRYEYSCSNCHDPHYPRLNAFGRRFRENGYQLPDGAEDPTRAKRNVEPGTLGELLAIFKELPFSMRGQVFGAAPAFPDAQKKPTSEVKLFSFLMGGGSIVKDVSFFFSWTPFPTPMLHHLHIGVHNIAADWIGRGTLNVRAGSIFLLDLQRTGHRFLAPGPTAAGSVPVGLNMFGLDDPQLGVHIYGRPGWGPLLYEVAVVTGDPGVTGVEHDDWKDVYVRGAYTLFHNTDHELTAGGFGYLGRSDILHNQGGIDLVLNDEFWIVGGDLDFAYGPVSASAMVYASRHDHPTPGVAPILFWALRSEVIVSITDSWSSSVRYEHVLSDDDPTLEAIQIAPHVTYQIATNVLASAVWRYDIRKPRKGSSFVLALEAAF